jgi:hypothetical protein
VCVRLCGSTVGVDGLGGRDCNGGGGGGSLENAGAGRGRYQVPLGEGRNPLGTMPTYCSVLTSGIA